jgi:alanine racemase
MAERIYTHYKYPLSRTQALPDTPLTQDYFIKRGMIPQERGPFPHNYIEVSLSAYEHNLQAIQNLTQHDEPDIIPIGKFGYMGMGGPLVSHRLIQSGATKIGLASSEELRFTHKEHPRIPALMMYPLQTFDDICHAIEHGAELTVQTMGELQLTQQAASALGRNVQIHVQAETGFHHYGGSLDELSAMFAYAEQNADDITIKGISSHFATAGDDNISARRQFGNFLNVLRHLHDQGHSVSSVHIANSAATVDLPETWKRETYAGVMPGAVPAIRPGGLIYGMYGDPKGTLQIQEVVTAVVSHISGAQTIAAGESVGYCKGYTANRKTAIATIPVGWGSGYLVENTQTRADDELHTQILIRGKRSPILGLVGASSFAVKNIGAGEKGEAVLLIGAAGKERITFDEVAAKNGMISTQLTTMLGKSLPQVYHEES